MKTLIVLVATLVLATASVLQHKRQVTCENQCEPGVAGTCSHGHVCLTIGEGGCTKCMILLPGKRQIIQCPMVMCASFCQYGYKVGADGCRGCECNPAPTA
ncbi:BPTI/Kunitz domain-containing protein 4-like [Physella acuta]|uniref:BPTI/Kunitz domain-containing protein 4-like n=1 Tax=Physella acuta TaxID=109671 RepID=UPI0027DD5772|nr:BPTI/Kunitz domain-containing protein 4-like [Physella acuta]